MATTYTRELWSVTSGGAGTITGPGPASGLRWVVVDVEAFNPTVSWEFYLGGFLLEDSLGYGIAINSPLEARGHKQFHWQGRQVLDNPHTLQLSVAEAGWLVRVTGFELTLP